MGNEDEASVAVRLRRLEADVERYEPVVDAVLTPTPEILGHSGLEMSVV